VVGRRCVEAERESREEPIRHHDNLILMSLGGGRKSGRTLIEVAQYEGFMSLMGKA